MWGRAGEALKQANLLPDGSLNCQHQPQAPSLPQGTSVCSSTRLLSGGGGGKDGAEKPQLSWGEDPTCGAQGRAKGSPPASPGGRQQVAPFCREPHAEQNRRGWAGKGGEGGGPREGPCWCLLGQDVLRSFSPHLPVQVGTARGCFLGGYTAGTAGDGSRRECEPRGCRRSPAAPAGAQPALWREASEQREPPAPTTAQGEPWLPGQGGSPHPPVQPREALTFRQAVDLVPPDAEVPQRLQAPHAGRQGLQLVAADVLVREATSEQSLRSRAQAPQRGRRGLRFSQGAGAGSGWGRSTAEVRRPKSPPGIPNQETRVPGQAGGGLALKGQSHPI